MNLLWQLVPYVALALVAVAGVTVYIAGASRRRRRTRASEAEPIAPGPVPGTAEPVRRGGSSPVDATRAQILRLREFGIGPPQIASVLGVPFEEVELVIQLEQYQLTNRGHQPARKEPSPARASRLSRA